MAQERVTVSGRVAQDISVRLDALANATARSRSFLVEEALRAYVEDQEWQIAAIREGLELDKAGDYATDEEVDTFFGKWGVSSED